MAPAHDDFEEDDDDATACLTVDLTPTLPLMQHRKAFRACQGTYRASAKWLPIFLFTLLLVLWSFQRAIVFPGYSLAIILQWDVADAAQAATLNYPLKAAMSTSIIAYLAMLVILLVLCFKLFEYNMWELNLVTLVAVAVMLAITIETQTGETDAAGRVFQDVRTNFVIMLYCCVALTLLLLRFIQRNTIPRLHLRDSKLVAMAQLERIDAGAEEVLASVQGHPQAPQLMQLPRGYTPRRPVRAVAIRYVAPWWRAALPLAQSHILSYIGEVDQFGRPCGYGEWRDSHWHGEFLRGFWWRGVPRGPFKSRETGSASSFVNLRLGYVRNRSEAVHKASCMAVPQAQACYGIFSAECSVSGAWFKALPEVEHLLGPYVLPPALPTLSKTQHPFAFGSHRLQASATAAAAAEPEPPGAAAAAAAAAVVCSRCGGGGCGGGGGAPEASACECGGGGGAGAGASGAAPPSRLPTPFPPAGGAAGGRELPWFARVLLDPECLSPEDEEEERQEEELLTAWLSQNLATDTDLPASEAPSSHRWPHWWRLRGDRHASQQSPSQSLPTGVASRQRRASSAGVDDDAAPPPFRLWSWSPADAATPPEAAAAASAAAAARAVVPPADGKASGGGSGGDDGGGGDAAARTAPMRQLGKLGSGARRGLWAAAPVAPPPLSPRAAGGGGCGDPRALFGGGGGDGRSDASPPAGVDHPPHASSARECEVVLFVHGLGCTSLKAIRTWAQFLALTNLPSHMVPLCFSWPAGKVAGYFISRYLGAEAEETGAALASLVAALAADGFRALHIICHSMGARVLANALPKLEALLADPTCGMTLATLTLLNPDYGLDAFRSGVGARMCSLCPHVTIYGDINDQALAMSEIFNALGRPWVRRWQRRREANRRKAAAAAGGGGGEGGDDGGEAAAADVEQGPATAVAGEGAGAMGGVGGRAASNVDLEQDLLAAAVAAPASDGGGARSGGSLLQRSASAAAAVRGGGAAAGGAATLAAAPSWRRAGSGGRGGAAPVVHTQASAQLTAPRPGAPQRAPSTSRAATGPDASAASTTAASAAPADMGAAAAAAAAAAGAAAAAAAGAAAAAAAASRLPATEEDRGGGGGGAPSPAQSAGLDSTGPGRPPSSGVGGGAAEGGADAGSGASVSAQAGGVAGGAPALGQWWLSQDLHFRHERAKNAQTRWLELSLGRRIYAITDPGTGKPLDVDVVDISYVAANVSSNRHVHHNLNKDIMQDMYDIIVHRKRAAQRRPHLEFLAGNVYGMKAPPQGLTVASL